MDQISNSLTLVNAPYRKLLGTIGSSEEVYKKEASAVEPEHRRPCLDQLMRKEKQYELQNKTLDIHRGTNSA